MAKRYLARWEPFRDLLNFRSGIDDVFGDFFGRMTEPQPDFWAPVVDVAENNGNIEVHAELPGMKKEDIKVTLRNNVLSISGERTQENETKEKTYHRIERFYGKFSRNIELPVEVSADKVKASYKDGVLSITMPKPESAKPKQIDVDIK
jgi:HSP20 family protein